jgi:HD superfamily phosphodiesterase
MNVTKLKRFVVAKLNEGLPEFVSYHGTGHTLAVLAACNAYIKRMKISKEDAHLLRTAALMHDIGIVWDYHHHEDRGIEFIKEILPSWGYTKKDVKIICNMIEATKIPQRPKNLLEQIMCDADLDYLGTKKFYEIGHTLYIEMKNLKIVKNMEEWDRVQVKFLQSHRYHTEFGKSKREPVKQKHLKELLSKWGW